MSAIPVFSAPSLSVVVVTAFSLSHLRECLSALGRQVQAPADMEVIAVYSADSEHSQDLEKSFPEVRFFGLRGRQTQETLRSFGVQQARGRIVALTVDHCTPEENWCRRLLESHKEWYGAVGGAVEMGTQPATLVNRAVHVYDYCNYGYYLSPVKEGPARDLSDCNVSYKRDILAAAAVHWQAGFNVALFNEVLLSRAEVLWLTPALIVHQNRDIGFRRAAWIAYRRGRAFASARLDGSSAGRRLGYLVSSPLLPAVLLRRLVKNTWPKRGHRKSLLQTLPAVVFFSILWSLGELEINLTGRRNVRLTTQEE